MPLIYITGPSGSGKSTVRTELQTRGYEAHDTDEDSMSAWYDNQTQEPVLYPQEANRPADWHQKHEYRLSAARMRALVKQAKSKLIFLCGIPANDKEFRQHYDKVICLVIDKETMQKRVASRTANDFGKSPDELKLMLYWHGKVLERYRDWGAIMVDADQPLDDVVNEIVSYCQDN